jgi:putative Mg2+ transporter-C (MgtC) family protein
MEAPSQWAVILAAAYAMLLGGLVGLERELKRKPAGFRTHMLVAGAAALLLGIGRLFIGEGVPNVEALQIDPLRLVEAVVAGVAFIGAGTIFSHRGGRLVEGITTAASLLMVAVIGIAAGLGYHPLAFAATALTLVVLVVLRWFEGKRDAAAGGAGPGRS